MLMIFLSDDIQFDYLLYLRERRSIEIRNFQTLIKLRSLVVRT